MIQPLRRRHRGAVLALSLTVPALAFLAWDSRPGPALQAELPAVLTDPVSARSAGDWVLLDGEGEIRARARFAPGARQVEIESAGLLAPPDVLAYWSAGETGEPDRLAEGSWLLGAFDGDGARVLAVPAAAPGGDGRLVLFSLAHGVVIGAAPMALPSSPDG